LPAALLLLLLLLLLHVLHECLLLLIEPIAQTLLRSYRLDDAARDARRLACRHGLCCEFVDAGAEALFHNAAKELCVRVSTTEQYNLHTTEDNITKHNKTKDNPRHGEVR